MGGSHRLFGSCPAIHLLHKKLALSRVGRPPRDSPTTPFHHLPKQAPPRKSSRPERAETDVVELLTHYTSGNRAGKLRHFHRHGAARRQIRDCQRAVGRGGGRDVVATVEVAVARIRAVSALTTA